jgi:putative aminopeptidase FrvX
MHSSIEMASMDDVERCIRLAVGFTHRAAAEPSLWR